jgi:ABC-2 type transport system ATP-binding protein
MTVEEYLAFAAELKKIPRAERKPQMEQVMEMTGIDDMRGRLIKNLSKGYRQRVGLAQAILGDPEVIILDEPSVGLDPKQIIEIRDLIRKLGENHTVILSSHILSEVSAVCDQILIIAHGQLVACDSPEGLQKLMTGSLEIELVVKGEFEAVKTNLEKLPNVDVVEKLEDQKDGCVKVKTISMENVDAREEIFFALADAKLPILEMHPNQRTLEDIFLELTEDVKPVEKKKANLFKNRTKKAPEDAAAVAEDAATDAEDAATVAESGAEASEAAETTEPQAEEKISAEEGAE